MLKAVIVDSNAISRGLLNTVLLDGGYEVVGQTHTSTLGYALALKHHPQYHYLHRQEAPGWLTGRRPGRLQRESLPCVSI